MNYLRRKPKAERLDRPVSVLRSDKHLRFVRGCACVVPHCEARDIEAAHCRSGLPAGEMGGIGIKPSDVWVTPQCREHHAESHRCGEKSFALKYGIALQALCLLYALQSTDKAIREKARSIRL